MTGAVNKNLVLSAMVFASGSGSGRPASLVHGVRVAFAHSTQTVFYIMAGVMAATFLISLLWLPRGRVELPDHPEVTADPTPVTAGP